PGWQPATGSPCSRPSRGSPLSHTSGVPLWQAPVTQVSVPVQTSPSSQSASVVQQPAIGAFTQPPALLLAAGSQESAVHTIPSSQVGAVPGTHVPSSGLQVSGPVQASPSSQSASVVQQPAIGAFTQPPVLLLAVGSQLSAVQTTASSQVGAVPATHWPVTASQVSVPLQKRPSSQVTLAGCVHAPSPSHWSAVQRFPSSVQAVAAGVAQWVFSSQGPLLHSAALKQGSPLLTHCPMI